MKTLRNYNDFRDVDRLLLVFSDTCEITLLFRGSELSAMQSFGTWPVTLNKVSILWQCNAGSFAFSKLSRVFAKL